MISALCGSEHTALQVTTAVFNPIIILSGKPSCSLVAIYALNCIFIMCSGVLWPLEGMPTVVRYIASVLPMTYPAQAMRALMGRGTGCVQNTIVLHLTVKTMNPQTAPTKVILEVEGSGYMTAKARFWH